MINSSKYVEIKSSIFGVKSSVSSGASPEPEPPIEQGWYDKITGLIYPDILITNFNEVIQWQQ